VNLDDILSVNGPEGPLRVRRSGKGAGMDPGAVEALVRKLLAVRAVDPAVDRYSSREGVRASWGADDSGPLVDLGDDEPEIEGMRLPGHDAVERALEALGVWSGRRPKQSLEAPALTLPRGELRQALLERLASMPQPDRQGEARRALESASVGGVLGALLGRSSAAGALGAARGVRRAFGDRFGDSARRWQGDVGQAARAVDLDERQARAINDNEVRAFGMDRDIGRAELSDWQAEGAGLNRGLVGALAELRAQQEDARAAREKAKGDAAIAKAEFERTEKVKNQTKDLFDKLSRYSPDAQQMFLDVMEGQGLPEAFKRGEDGKWIIPGAVGRQGVKGPEQVKAEAAAKAQGERNKALTREAEGLRRDLLTGKMSVSDRLRARARLAEIKKFAGVGPGDTLKEGVALTPAQEKAARDRAESRAAAERRASSRKGADSTAGPKNGALERYQTLVRNSEVLRREVDAAEAALRPFENRGELGKEEKAASNAAQSRLSYARSALQANLAQRIKLEADYPEIKERAGVMKERTGGGVGKFKLEKVK
jgi:hypothetical protein